MADGLKDLRGLPLGADFINVYAAGLLANGGWPAAVYDWPTHSLLVNAVAGYNSPYFAWHYPPMFLAVAALVALLPYLWAFFLYMAATFTAYWSILKRILPPTKEAFWMMAAFPGAFCNLINGQNGFLTAALLGGGLWMLEKNQWVAGLILGLLSYKPQFFIAIPLLLAFGGYWRAFLATGLAALASASASYAFWGHETWLAFFNSLSLTQHIIVEQGATGFEKIQSVFALARLWNMSIRTSYVVQAIVAVGAILCAAWVWRRKASMSTRAAALCAALILATPYLLDYDLVILAVPIAFWVREAAQKPLVFHDKALLACLWVLPILTRITGAYYLPLTPPLMMILLVACVERTLSKPASPVAAAPT